MYYSSWCEADAACKNAVTLADRASEAVKEERAIRETAERARAQAVRDLVTMAHEVVTLASRVSTYHTLVPAGVQRPGDGGLTGVADALQHAVGSTSADSMVAGSKGARRRSLAPTRGSPMAQQGASKRRASVRASIVLTMPSRSTSSGGKIRTLSDVHAAMEAAADAGVGATGHVELAAEEIRLAIQLLSRGSEAESVLGQ